MDIINHTSVIFNVQNCNLVTQVVYEAQDVLTINPSRTYRQVLTQKQSSGLFIHDLNEKQIREATVRINNQEFKAINAQRFIDFIKQQFLKREPQTIAQFILPAIKITDELFCNAKHIKFPLPPWDVEQLYECRSQQCDPLIQTIHYYPSNNQLTALLHYPVKTQGLITIKWSHHEKI